MEARTRTLHATTGAQSERGDHDTRNADTVPSLGSAETQGVRGARSRSPPPGPCCPALSRLPPGEHPAIFHRATATGALCVRWALGSDLSHDGLSPGRLRRIGDGA